MGGYFSSLLTVQAGQVIDGDRDVLASMRRRSVDALSTDLPGDKPVRQPFHWPLEFPEVMGCSRRGFDALIGNPPFMGGKKITTAFGEAYRECLVKGVANDQRGNADLSAYFFLRAASLLRNGGALGMLATSTLSQGETRRICLGFLSAQDYSIYRAIKSFDWPGKANLAVSMVWIFNGPWRGQFHLGMS